MMSAHAPHPRAIAAARMVLLLPDSIQRARTPEVLPSGVRVLERRWNVWESVGRLQLVLPRVSMRRKWRAFLWLHVLLERARDGIHFPAMWNLIDKEAMLEKLRDGTIRLAGLDVFRTEPLPADSPFWDLPNVIVNPHSASTSIHENGRIVEIFSHNLACFLDGRTSDMRNVLDIEHSTSSRCIKSVCPSFP